MAETVKYSFIIIKYLDFGGEFVKFAAFDMSPQTPFRSIW